MDWRCSIDASRLSPVAPNASERSAGTSWWTADAALGSGSNVQYSNLMHSDVQYVPTNGSNVLQYVTAAGCERHSSISSTTSSWYSGSFNLLPRLASTSSLTDVAKTAAPPGKKQADKRGGQLPDRAHAQPAQPHAGLAAPAAPPAPVHTTDWLGKHGILCIAEVAACAYIVCKIAGAAALHLRQNGSRPWHLLPLACLPAAACVLLRSGPSLRGALAALYWRTGLWRRVAGELLAVNAWHAWQGTAAPLTALQSTVLLAAVWHKAEVPIATCLQWLPYVSATGLWISVGPRWADISLNELFIDALEFNVRPAVCFIAARLLRTMAWHLLRRTCRVEPSRRCMRLASASSAAAAGLISMLPMPQLGGAWAAVLAHVRSASNAAAGGAIGDRLMFIASCILLLLAYVTVWLLQGLVRTTIAAVVKPSCFIMMLRANHVGFNRPCIFALN